LGGIGRQVICVSAGRERHEQL